MSTIDPALPPLPPVRAEYVRTLDTPPDAERAAPAPLVRRIAGASAFRRGVIALVLIAVWEIIARIVANDLLVPTVGSDAGRVRARHRVGRTAREDGYLDVGAAARLCARRGVRVRADVACGIDAHRP
jgi:hypothetical protein